MSKVKLLSALALICILGLGKDATALPGKHEPAKEVKIPVPSAASVMNYMKMVADWQMTNPTGKPFNCWEYGPFYQGLFRLYKLSGRQKYYDSALAMGERINWEPPARPFDANALVIIPVLADLYRMTKDIRMIDKSRYILDMSVGRKQFMADNPDKVFPPEVNLKNNKYWAEWWTWCDALFMAPPAYASMAQALNKPEYLSFMMKHWWLTSDYLYSKPDSLYFRDDSFFDLRTENGRKIFWARGNGWVIGGLCGVMDFIPKENPVRQKFEQQFVEMCGKLAEIQKADGLWGPSLADTLAFPQKETSGTAFFCYGLAWGVNNGLLSREKYMPHILKAWQALTACVKADGKLGYVQRVGDSPANVMAEDTESYGTGAFLMAANEVYKLVK